jgi:hypothetical protein
MADRRIEPDPFTTAQIVPLRRRKQAPECIYPEMRKAGE